MIQLRNVSKFYYSKGMIASGISKVNLDFDLGEFVVITGESGSGKTTLLNVISGLDSYEEGEMYINGEETSHYLAADFEEYRKKYIGNIFQNFNLVNSYTVYQNIELILLINGYSKEQIQRRVDEIIDRVGLTAFRKTKVSKLSGGQRQRVSIARALAKDTDIIVADEPTGNLDSESAQGVVSLLSEIARDKLVIVVTHNYEQFEAYATRRVKMHDGKVVENVIIQPTQPPAGHQSGSAGGIAGGSVLRLGVRNTFNIFYKFLLLLMVFLFLVFAVSSQYTTLVNKQYESSILGYNSYFYNYSNDRVILKKSDGGVFTEEDYTALGRMDNIESIAPNDILLDTSLYLESDLFSLEAFPHSITEFTGKPDLGRMPEAPGEALLRGANDGYTLSEDIAETILDESFQVWVGEDGEIPITIVGIAFDDSADDNYNYSGEVYLSDEQIQQMRTQLYGSGSTIITTINGKDMEAGLGDYYYRVLGSNNVAKGSAVVSEDVSNFFLSEEEEDLNMKAAIGHDIDVKVRNMFYTEKMTLKISDVYTEKTFAAKTGDELYDEHDGAIYISQEDYATLFDKGNFQCSVYLKDLKNADETVNAMKDLGYTVLPLKDTVMGGDEDIVSMLEVPIAILIVLAIFCIAYIVAGLILRSRSSYFSILRMLGLAKKNIRRILDVEVLLVANLAFGIFLVVVALVRKGAINIEYLKTLMQYMQLRDFVILYLLISVMALLISVWFSRRLFRKTAMGSFREEE